MGMNRKHKVASKCVLLAAGMAAVMLTVSQSQVLAKSDGKWNDPCEHLRDRPGKALGLKKRCAVGSSSGVARADFNHDGYGDLAIGAPYEDVGSADNSGAVYVIYGSPSGLLAPASSGPTPVAQRWTQSSSGVPGDPEKDDNFGTALADGDFNNDGISDLAIGAPNESVGTTQDGTNYLNLVDAGEVDVLYGSGSGLSKAERVPQMWHQDRPNVEGKVEAGDHFGFTLSAWNFSGPDVLADLAIGVPLEDVNGVTNCGAVAVLYSTTANNGLSSLGDQLWHPNVANVPGSCQTNGKFGAAMY